MTDNLIDALGGYKALAQELGVTQNAESNWRSPDRVFPWSKRPVIARMAAERGVALPSDFWGEAA